MMNHRVRSVQELYNDSKELYDVVVQEKADAIINDLEQTINILKNSWAGKDAGVQIQNVVEVHNAMAKIRNALAELAKDSTTVAAEYREIQRANRADMDGLIPVTIGSEKAVIDNYDDNRDTISITEEALNGKNKLDNVNALYDEFEANIRRYYNAIMDNWQAGNGREKATQAFDEFMASASKYKRTLQDVSQSISDSIRNYQK